MYRAKEHPILVPGDQITDGLVLNNGVFLVSGITKAAIYDTEKRNVYSVNSSGKRVLLNRESDEQYLQELKGLDLLSDKEGSIKSPELTRQNNLKFVWFEIVSEDCNERCIHCYADSMPIMDRKKLAIYANEKERLTYDNWVTLMEQVLNTGCTDCQFIGGEPFLFKGERGQTVLTLAEKAVGLGFKFIEIYSNAVLLTEEKVKKIKALGIHMAVSLYSVDPNIHDKITRTPGSCLKTMAGLELLKKYEVPTRVESVVMNENLSTVGQTSSYIEKMGFTHKSPDVIRPNGRGSRLDLLPDVDTEVSMSYLLAPNFSTSLEGFIKNISGNSCLSGKIVITDTGEVIPCIFARDQVCGNVQTDDLVNIIGGSALQKVWGSTKDDVLVCKDCEYRYSCGDCRPMSEAASLYRGDFLSSPFPRCTYNPYEGRWGDGFWRLEDSKTPVYDMSKAEAINKVRNFNTRR